jgi:uncharacterized protein
MGREMKMRRPMTIVAAVALALAPTPGFAGPIHDAARRADIGVVANLVKGGADIDERDADGSTPLIIAALSGKTALVNTLLMLGADVKVRNDRGMTALHAAAFSGDLESLKWLQAAGADLNDAANKFGVTPLIVAAEDDRRAVVSYLIAYGADLEITERHGYTALTRAGYHGHDQAITLLLKAGAACQDGDPLWFKDCTARKAALGL